MWRGSSKRDMIAWTAIGCFLAFGSGFVLVKRFRPAGPVEFKELPMAPVSQPVAPTAHPKPFAQQFPEPAATIPPPITTQQPAGPTVKRKVKGEPEAQSISVNTGDLTELEKLPGVGPGIAQKIIDYRTANGPFQSIEDLRNVKGLGENRLAKIAPYVRL